MADPTRPATRVSGEEEVATYPPELVRFDVTVETVRRDDAIPPPAALAEQSDLRLGTGPIPAARYFSREYFELEKERLWPRVWQFACWGYDIPNPGDVHVYRILDRSVLIVRQRDGSLKAFHNACLHRGREICERSGHRAQLKCPFHFFTWSLAGELKWVPSKWDFPQIDEARFRLPEVRLEEWNGFVFINFDQDAMPLARYIGRMARDWERWDFSNRFKAVHVVKRIRCNWKTAQDIFIEGFHSFASHPQYAVSSPEDSSQLDVYADEPHTSRFQTVIGVPAPRLNPQPTPDEVFDSVCNVALPEMLPEAIGTEEARLQPGETARAGIERIYRRAYGRNFGMDTSGMTTTEVVDPIAYFIFPNTMPWPSLAFPLFYRLLPDAEDPEWCTWETMMFTPFKGERPPSAPIIHLGPEDSFEDIGLGAMGLLFQQDANQLPAIQRGMHNLVDCVLNIGEYHEIRIRHYHRTLDQYLGG
jgi:phenylpropionate dioxygenase-like ring-hydroxylating dioxygenase large terminal subunit